LASASVTGSAAGGVMVAMVMTVLRKNRGIKKPAFRTKAEGCVYAAEKVI
jgi:hypothetical protein